MLTDLSQENFNLYRNRLISFSRKFHLINEDAEEIVNDSILQALKNYDSDRGNFESFCKVILTNKIFNFKRDNKDLFILVILDENDDFIDGENISYEEKESNVIALKFLNELKENLTPEELQLFNEIYNICDSSEKMNISKASKNLGIDPKKGWDIFRRIQRKAGRKKEDEPVVFYCKELVWKKIVESDYGLSKFLHSLPEGVLAKINSLYNS